MEVIVLLVILVILAIWAFVPVKENDKIAKIEKKINEYFAKEDK